MALQFLAETRTERGVGAYLHLLKIVRHPFHDGMAELIEERAVCLVCREVSTAGSESAGKGRCRRYVFGM